MSRKAAVRLDGIEAGRGLAASAVVFYHAARHLNKIYGVPLLMSFFQFGHAGVDLFFVISGFIILFVHYNDIDRPQRLGHYLGRRFTRVMPTYWVALTVTIALSLIGSHAIPTLSRLLMSVFLLPSHHEPLLGIAWTLQYEIAFYAIFCILILNRMLGMVVFVFWLLLIALGNAGVFGDAILPKSLYGLFNVEFFFGMGAAYWLKNHGLPKPLFVLTIGIFLFMIAAIAEDAHYMDGYADIARFAYGIPAMLIVLGSAEISRQKSFIIPHLVRSLGSASYSIYLFQFIFIGILWQLLLHSAFDKRLPLIVIFLVLAIGAVTGGIFVSRVVEHPLIRLVRGSNLKEIRSPAAS